MKRTHRPAPTCHLIEALEDRIAPATFIVTTAADSGAGSLRAALLSAETDAVADTITFNIAGPGVHTIHLTSSLPQITHPVTINGASEPGYVDAPVIELDGTGTSGVHGLLISSNDVTVKALTINQFDGCGILVNGGSGHVTVQGCFIGVDATGSVASPNGSSGILMQAPNAIIGGHTSTERNVIAGNLGSGVLITSTGAVVQGNYIGTNLLGSLQIPNKGDGVTLSGGGNHTVGGPLPGYGNVLSGNGANDLSIFNSSGNTVAGNILGLDLPMKVELQSQGDGIAISGTSSSNTIGGTVAGARNVIAAHDETGAVGLRIIGSGTGNVVLGNLIGTNPTGDDELENNLGIFVTASGTTIGDLAGHGNFVAGNKGYGIEANGAQNFQLLGNHVGLYTDVGDLKLANGTSGVNIFGGTNALVRGNVISGNNANGLIINNSLNATIQGNSFGTDSPGLAARGNGAAGILAVNCPGLLIGGSGLAQGNVLSGNGTYGIDIFSAQPVKVFGNLIGTDSAGIAAIPDGDSGLRVASGSGHLIGGAGAGEGNVISGSFRGVQLATGGNFVRGNLIGLNKAGTGAVTGASAEPLSAGVYVFAGSNNIIGGTLPGEGNTIAGNLGQGVVINGSGAGNQLLGNFIGTNAAGAAGLGNGGANASSTISISAPGTIVGGPGAARNLIDSGSGRAINVANAANVVLKGNWIGLAPDGVTKLGNQSGIDLTGSGTVNATITNNVISGCAGAAISATDNGGHVIKGNRLGTDASGMAMIKNQRGLSLTRETNVTIGGLAAGEGNLVAGSGSDAILLTGGTNISIMGNLVGLNASGTKALPNSEGISINSAPANPVSSVLVVGNLIAGSAGSGINLSGAQTDTRVQSNLIGLAANGIDPLPNGQGISIGHGSGLLIGGTVGQGNTIAFSQAAGLGVYFADSGNIQILSNVLRQNGESGISLGDVSGTVTIGSATGGNTFQSNTGPGIILDNSQQTLVQGNLISGNGGAGVLVQNGAKNNTIGGVALAAGNRIANNGGAGVAVASGSGNFITHNLISGNNGLAIDLGATGATANDPLDADTGANGLQNAPTLTGVALLPNGHTVLLGSLESTASTPIRIEVYSILNDDPAHFRGEAVLGTTTAGQALFQIDLGILPAGEQVIATASNLATGETSELGGLPPATVVPTLSVSGASVMEGPTGNGQAVFTVSLSAVPTVPVSFDYGTLSGSATAGVDYTTTTGTFTFPAGSTKLTTSISVPVLDDLTPETAEHFTLQLSHEQSAYLLVGTGDGVILNNDSTLVIDAKGKTAHWRDLDGDLVTLKVSKPILTSDDFVFLADGNGGEQLAALLLADDGAVAAKTNIQLTAKRDPLHPMGDGHANLGFLDATGLDLATVKISGDLGRLSAGDLKLSTPGVKKLSTGSIGFFGLATQSIGGSLQTEIAGSVGSVTVRGDVQQAGLHIAGAAGAVKIAGNLLGGSADFSGSLRIDGQLGALSLGGSLQAGTGLGSGTVSSGGTLGKVVVKGSLLNGAHVASGGNLGPVSIGGELAGLDAAHQATISAAGNIAQVKIGGSVTTAEILAGFSSDLQPINPDAKIGAVRVTDNWIASNLVAGLQRGADGLFGTADDAPAAAVAPAKDNPLLFSKIASIQVGGYISGSANDASDHFAFTAQRIGKLSAGALGYVLNSKAPDQITLGMTNDVTLIEAAA